MIKLNFTHQKKAIGLALFFIQLSSQLYAFCGFYVAKAGSQLFNNKSEVIIVRDGTLTTLTMSNDFKGDVKDFAMVVPVPEILRERDIKVVDRFLFDRIDAYSSPRLVEYYDDDPCESNYKKFKVWELMSNSANEKMTEMDYSAAENKVTIEAKYTIDEYDIMILSAEESNGLESFLKENGYAIPDNAREVLQPYINDNLKFFVVKVNLKNQSQSNYNYLRPIQITYNSERFMLPIRLGMANSRGSQDLIIYAFTKKGRIECTNYRTVKMTTDNHIPTFVLNQFDSFYIKNFNRQYYLNNRNAVFLEYAWNVTPSFNGVKCDPCVGNPPMLDEFIQAGVNWLNTNPNSSVFFTRLHVRYSRDKFPQDLQFQETPNNENFQARYVITHPSSKTNCSKGKAYLLELEERRVNEVIEFCKLTGNHPSKYNWYASNLSNNTENEIEKSDSNSTFENSTALDSALINNQNINLEKLKTNINTEGNKKEQNFLMWLILPLFLMSVSVFQKYWKKSKIRSTEL